MCGGGVSLSLLFLISSGFFKKCTLKRADIENTLTLVLAGAPCRFMLLELRRLKAMHVAGLSVLAGLKNVKNSRVKSHIYLSHVN